MSHMEKYLHESSYGYGTGTALAWVFLDFKFKIQHFRFSLGEGETRGWLYSIVGNSRQKCSTFYKWWFTSYLYLPMCQALEMNILSRNLQSWRQNFEFFVQNLEVLEDGESYTARHGGEREQTATRQQQRRKPARWRRRRSGEGSAACSGCTHKQLLCTCRD